MRFSPKIDPAFFPGTAPGPAAFFWSSFPVAGSPSDGWGVGFFFGTAGGYVATLTDRARCVR